MKTIIENVASDAGRIIALEFSTPPWKKSEKEPSFVLEGYYDHTRLTIPHHLRSGVIS